MVGGQEGRGWIVVVSLQCYDMSGMRYIGSKAFLLDNIKAVVYSRCGAERAGAKIFCDLFSGTGVVARFFKKDYRIIANDMLYFPYIVTSAGIENNAVPAFRNVRKPGVEDPVNYLDNLNSALNQNCFVQNRIRNKSNFVIGKFFAVTFFLNEIRVRRPNKVS